MLYVFIGFSHVFKTWQATNKPKKIPLKFISIFMKMTMKLNFRQFRTNFSPKDDEKAKILVNGFLRKFSCLPEYQIRIFPSSYISLTTARDLYHSAARLITIRSKNLKRIDEPDIPSHFLFNPINIHNLIAILAVKISVFRP